MEPFTTAALAAAITTMVNGVAGEAGKTAWTSLTGYVRSKFGRDSAPAAALSAVEDHPNDEAQAERFAVVLQDLARDEGVTAHWLQPWFEQALTASRTAPPVNNVIGGQATVHGPIVQAQTINGTINF